MAPLLISLILPHLYHPACLASAERHLPPRMSTAEQHRRLSTCTTIAFEAEKRGHSSPLFVELAWSESGWQMGAFNQHTGVFGPLQASPKYFCPDKTLVGCDPIKAGFDAWEEILRRGRTSLEANLCHYKAGNVCTPVALQGGRRVLRRKARLKVRLHSLYSRKSI